MRYLKKDMDGTEDLTEAATLFRGQIWAMVETWVQNLMLEKDEDRWHFVSESQLIDNIPTLLGGISRVIENPERILDFEPGGVIHRAASELGKNRWTHDFKVSEILYEQELLRDVIWTFCRAKLVLFDFYELEGRINQSLYKALSATTNSYIRICMTEIRHHAKRDRLTDFLNYESFREAIDAELKRSRRYRHSFSLIMMDIDWFKDYTDSLGIVAGDELIQTVSGIIASVVRNVDILVRYGTDEFVVVLPETNKKQAGKVAERLRRAIKLQTRYVPQTPQTMDKPRSVVTVSIGLSSYPKDAKTVDEIISLADSALFEAKNSGKDMVVWG